MNKIETIKLENGLKIYLLLDKRKHSTFFQFTTFCGGCTKNFQYHNKDYHLKDGIAHMLEHYIVECNDDGNFLETLGKLQMNTNASTSTTTTSYYFEAVENIKYGIQTILKGVYHIKFQKEKLEKLKNPIIQEIRGKMDNKFYYLNLRRIENLFINHDYKDVGGKIDEIKETKIENLKLLYNAFYRPNNQFITIVGNFDKNEVLETIEGFYKSNPIKNENTKKSEIIEPKTVKIKESYFIFPTPLDYVDISIKISKKQYTPDELLDLSFYLQSFLISKFGPSSNLYQELIDKKIILEPLHFGTSHLHDYLIVTIGGYSRNTEELKKILLKEIKDRDNLDEERFELDKKNSTIRLVLRDENIFKMIGPFLNNIIDYQYPYLDKIEDINRLNYKDYTNSIKNLDFSNYTVTFIYDKEKNSSI